MNLVDSDTSFPREIDFLSDNKRTLLIERGYEPWNAYADTVHNDQMCNYDASVQGQLVQQNRR